MFRDLTHTGWNWRCLFDWLVGLWLLAALWALALALLMTLVYAALWVFAYLVSGLRHAIT